MAPAPIAMSLAVLEMARGGRFGEIRELFAPQLRPMVTPEALQVAWAAELERCGPLTAVGEPLSEPVGTGLVVVKVPVTCERAAFTLLVSVTGAGLLAGIQLAPEGAAEPTAPGSRPRTPTPPPSTRRTSCSAPRPVPSPGR